MFPGNFGLTSHKFGKLSYYIYMFSGENENNIVEENHKDEIKELPQDAVKEEGKIYKIEKQFLLERVMRVLNRIFIVYKEVKNDRFFIISFS